MRAMAVWALVVVLSGAELAFAEVTVAELGKKDDTVKTSVKDGVLQVEVISPSGIGGCWLALRGGEWPAKAVIRFSYGEGKRFKALEGFHATLEKPNDSGITSEQRKGEDGGPEVELKLAPKAGAKVLHLEWIDQFRQ